MSTPTTFAVLACGARGQTLSGWIRRHQDRAKLVALADPNPDKRQIVGDLHAIPADLRFESYQQLLARPKLADAVLNTTMDPLHGASAIAALSAGYHMLLEKPMATTAAECAAIAAAAKAHSRIVSVCHSLRYHTVYRAVKKMLDEKLIGDIVTIDQLEAVDPVHQAHSFVRGNWANTARSTFMLMGKSCHDVDILCYLVGRDCSRVASAGALTHFTKANQPPGAPPRCTDGCPVGESCPYHSVKMYVDGPWGGFINLQQKTKDQRLEFVRTSPYGRCVYDCDNDVVDHQTVQFEFDRNITGTFTMTAFAKGGRQLRVHGTRGEIHARIDDNRIHLRTFWDPARDEVITLPPETGGHGGGDDNVMAAFVEALRTGDTRGILTDAAESWKTHAVTFAAERARLERRVVDVSEIARKWIA
jgi:predicted dehydrogenase